MRRMINPSRSNASGYRRSPVSRSSSSGVLTETFRQRRIDVRAAVRLFEETFTLVVPDALESPTCRDRDNDVVLATARAGECAAIVTGDQIC
jgi:predicted nucleic acid-binding protein